MSQCGVCAKEALFRCSGCGEKQYCSTECQTQDWPNHRNECVRPPATDEVESPEDFIESLRYYVTELYTILKPVLLCILLSVLWVKVTNPPSLFFATGAIATFTPSIGNSFGTTGGDSDNQSLIVAGIIMGQIVVSTVIMACLMHYGKIKIILGILGVVMVLLLGFFGFQLFQSLLTIANLPLDWISMIFYLWNFVAVGITSVFFVGPPLLKKAYLVVISSMMALSLSQLPELVTWLLLAFLAVWDLIAVLCPFGPLRLLIESAERNGTEIPSALIYSAMVWMMASPGDPPIASEGAASLAEPPATLAERRDSLPPTHSRASLIDRRAQSFEMQPLNQPPAEQEEEEGKGLKLGLGDFVFYSVLVGRASLYDWITTVGTILAVISGLVLTIFILVLTKRPLPALPISIFFGILIFLVGTLTLSPMIESLVSLTTQKSLLLAGTSEANFIYL